MAHTKGKLQISVCVLGLAGMALLVFLLRRAGAEAVAISIRAAGWGVVAVVAFHLVPLSCDAIAWGALFPESERPTPFQLFWMRWMGESVSTLLPAAQVGGDIVRARLAALKGAPLPTSAASIVVDITLSIFAQAAFTIGGLTLFAKTTGRISAVEILGGAIVAVAAIGGFYFVQRSGIFKIIGKLVSRLGSDTWKTLGAGGESLDKAIATLYHRRGGIAVSATATMSSWILGAGEVYIAMVALGLKASIAEALILESVSQGIRAAMFLVPGALGFQEGGYVGVGAALGLPRETAMALALIRRVREVSFGLVGVIAWQMFETHRAWRIRSASPSTPASAS
ncbi:MAG TPA: flippase-like domain-containing protein [Tepidisphaeraceae bacterium]|jgi:putative membrane protein|nr:flippase-like domain-containing protein [Tepidisphaeraceae bacterium]